MKHKLTGQGGKGSTDRTKDKDRFNKEFDRIFKPSKDKKKEVK